MSHAMISGKIANMISFMMQHAIHEGTKVDVAEPNEVLDSQKELLKEHAHITAQQAKNLRDS